MTFSPFDDGYPRYTPTSMFGQALKHQVREEAVIKRGKAVLLGWALHNAGFGDQRVIFYDGELSAKVDWDLVLAPGETSSAEFAMGIPFYHGLAYAQTGSISGLLLYA